jgi:hypothetical protein
MVEGAREAITELGVEAHVTYGDPAEELTVYSASVDLLVIGSRNYGPFGCLIHGSIAKQLARTARCPLLVLPRGARDASPAASSENPPGRRDRRVTPTSSRIGCRGASSSSFRW